MAVFVSPICALKDNYIWSIVDETTSTTVIVDPGDAKPVEHDLAINKQTLKAILITHHHWDHTNGAHALREAFNVPVYGPNNSQIQAITHPVKADDVVVIPDFPLAFRVFAIPGHTLDHLAYYTDGMLFCGDTLFSAGCGRLFEGTAEQMFTSLQTLASLPPDTKVYCAHEYTLNNLRFAHAVEPDNQAVKDKIEQVKQLREQNLPSLPSTLGEELKMNPFLRSQSLQEFIERRKWKDRF